MPVVCERELKMRPGTTDMGKVHSNSDPENEEGQKARLRGIRVYQVG